MPVSQSLAIVRVLGRKAGIEGKTDADFAKSEMLIEESNDLYASLGKAMYPTTGAEGCVCVAVLLWRCAARTAPPRPPPPRRFRRPTLRARSRPAAFAEFFGAGGACAKHLAALEKLIVNSRFTSTTTTGELAVVAIISIIKDLKPTAEFLAATPGIAAFYAAREESANKALANLGTYFKTTA